MKIFNTISLIILPLLFILSSCEKDAKNIKEPDFNPKLVLSSFISPNEASTNITINSSQKIYGDISEKTQAGELSILFSDGSKEIGLGTTANNITISRDLMAIVAGKTYKLTVNNDKGLKAEASCTVPAERDFKIKIDTLTKFISGGWGTYSQFSADLTITDYPGESNYYRFYGTQQFYQDGYYWEVPVIYETDYQDYMFDDSGRDGKTFLAESIGLYPSSNDSSFLKIYLLNTDKAYYDFHNSLTNYSGGDDPFTEVSPIYSNVEGGLGIFSAYTVDSLIFRIK